MEDEFKNLGITSEEDTISTAKKVSEAVCSTCGEPNASKKCKKRHAGCKFSVFCGTKCEKQGHKKKADKDDDDEKKPVDTAAAMDAAFAKIAKREERKVKTQKN